MEKFYVLDGLQVNMEMEQVLHAIDCTPDSPVYEEMQEEYRAICTEMLELAEPVGILGVGSLSEAAATEEYPAGTRVVYGVLSVGDAVKQCSTRAFAEGDYVRGMLCDAMADVMLFSLEAQMQQRLREVCAEWGVGILKRLEAPHDISMEVQREAWEYLQLKERFGVDISCGYMFDPVKTSCQVFVISEDATLFESQHDCSKCANLSCKYRKVPEGVKVTVRTTEGDKVFALAETESLMDGLLRESVYINAVCGGGGRCGKCKVCVVAGSAPISHEDRKFFSEEELCQGWRLSCMLYPTENITISLSRNREMDFEVISAYAKKDEQENTGNVVSAEGVPGWYEIAIDIGTTTLAFQLLDKANGKVYATVTAINHQRKYGADVVSRIQASIDGKKGELQQSIRRDLRDGIGVLLEQGGVKADRVRRIAIGANTTMVHLLMGYDCDSLGVYPFAPVNITTIKGTMQEIIGMDGEAEVVVLPGISTYVGGDIVAGLYACDFHKSEAVNLLIDLGTNGEMALGNREKILVTSTAAGPAFEGGNITWGMGSVAGAVCSVKLTDDGACVETIQNKEPVGICGTGVVEAVAELLREELLDETGLLEDAYFETGYPLAKTPEGEDIVLTQKDIRELQLAKAAVRAGIETLLLRYGIDKDAVNKVYLAGGFGYRLSVEKAIAIGMLPEEFAGRVQAVGNSCLAGAVKYLQDERAQETLEKLVALSEERNLSMDGDFNESYMEAMMFEVL